MRCASRGDRTCDGVSRESFGSVPFPSVSSTLSTAIRRLYSSTTGRSSSRRSRSCLRCRTPGGRPSEDSFPSHCAREFARGWDRFDAFTFTQIRRGPTMLVDVPRWSLLLFVLVFAAIAALVAANRRDEADAPAPAPQAPCHDKRAGGPPTTCARCSRSPPSTAATARGRSAGDAGDGRVRRRQAAGRRLPRQHGSVRVPNFRERSPPRLLTAASRCVRRPHAAVLAAADGRGTRARGRARLRGRRRSRRCAAARSRSSARHVLLPPEGAGGPAGRSGGGAVVDQTTSPSAARSSARAPASRCWPSGGAGAGLAGQRADLAVDAVSRAAGTPA